MQLRLASVGDLGLAAWALGRSGLLGPHRPDRLWGIAGALRRWGVTLGATYAMGAARSPDRVAVIDDEGTLSFADMDRRTSTVASALADLGIGRGDQVGLLSRNHRDFLTAAVALAKLGADTIYLNTGFAGRQVQEVATREGAKALIVDEEFVAATSQLDDRVTRVVAAGEAGGDNPSFAGFLAAGAREGPPAPGRVGAHTILTSGTTGTPKGARRDLGAEVAPLVALLTKIPFRTTDTTVLAAPMFHSWGLANMAVGLLFGATLIPVRHFGAEETLRLVERHRATCVAAVPVMIQRIMELPAEVRGRYDTSTLRVVALSGSALAGDLAIRFMDEFGDVVYNLYGSTEIGWASIATPGDLRAAPGTAGRVPIGTHVRLFDPDGREVDQGASGRIFVHGGLLFEGYTGGGGKDVIDGYMATGDVGHFDGSGRLFVDGRDDEMIVSGGENVFPREVEDLLAAHPAVADAAVIGVADERFGQRLKAFVVRREAGAVSEEDLKDHVRQGLARYKVPREIVFLSELPRNPTGKVLKRELS
ncbi:MAG TPA: AMP-binding protein [Acidimicrobiales bacterium]|nr:AMP-binding protein [Acidimicrobiales bacterium]